MNKARRLKGEYANLKRKWMDASSEMGCIVSRLYYGSPETPCVLHHPRKIGGLNIGMGLRANDFHVIPLKPLFHNGNDSNLPSIHMQPILFVDCYASEQELLKLHIKLMQQDHLSLFDEINMAHRNDGKPSPFLFLTE